MALKCKNILKKILLYSSLISLNILASNQAKSEEYKSIISEKSNSIQSDLSDQKYNGDNVITVTGNQSRKYALREGGGGLIYPENNVKSVSSVQSDFISRQAAGANAFQLAAMLPGANVASSDPLGLSPQTNISVRGLNNDALGYVLEGMPLNDIAYYTGYPGQFADSENYSQISLAQGSADLDSPVMNAAGGLMSLKFQDPSMKAGGYFSGSYGSYESNRQFIRLETGDIAHTGIRAFVSYSHSGADNWRGPGHDLRHHIDFKILKEWNENRVSLIGSWNRAVASYYPQVSLSEWKKFKTSGSNNLAKIYNVLNDNSGTDYYKLWKQPEKTFYLGAPIQLKLADKIKLHLTPYVQEAYGNVPGGSQIATSGLWNGTQPINETIEIPGAADGLATVRANSNQRSLRSGVNLSVNWKTGWNNFVLGYWFDYSRDQEKQTFTSIDATGHASNIWAYQKGSLIRLSDGSPLLAANFRTNSELNAFYIGDKMSLLHDRLLIDIGFKEVILNRYGINNMPGPQHSANSHTSEPLPRIGIRYKFNNEHQLFFNTSTNFRAPSETALYNAYDPSSGEIETKANTNVKNEYSVSEEFGYRYAGNLLIGNVTLFNYHFTNRQIETQIIQNGSIISSTINAGAQTSRGIDIELGLRPWHHFSPYVSGEYLYAKIDNDLQVGDDFLPTKGKTAVRSPRFQAAVGLTYDDGHFFSVATIHYIDRQYATFTNDERISAHVTGDLSIGYRFSDAVRLQKPTIRMNFINITNKHYISGVADPTFNAKDTVGRHGNIISGSSPDYYIGGGFAALFTASTEF
ncbi:TonB-dependent receptor [Zymomonas mobilis subsp. mobilis ZM4 = ATCC 31821]|uniref:TonB-dependent receptor n=1 Tax=Zymomonas mobilis subsp. mobilis (strain ATCC 31821 / ZM4 / CP4) TaxID=264203 RepID=Q5NMH3_ZYMMO|nr:TonB-dependent receptor [Zymomonas mobilis]AAV90087.2 TonB-dependent receptor [Zymomonas mobilis subsp. mobilis ZM4 = ATCC 31821]AVZ26310.1 TonB-dependent receptor [Zymomonas mobilis subsp. mobilis]AVZ28197.1 TonB-dependent receptor [Zymomonas mobilis subsp. mobilis]AVZ42642.1 TonB-dependent receptor [Zymomonas mobilis subsp. mobilis ZM4 = ATCC 31821]UBQ07408.1 TonB-dependent receptor [Zymomonas mobilis]